MPTKKKAPPLKKFTVIAAYMGECCMNAHLSVETVKAPDKPSAIHRVRHRLESEGCDVGDVVVAHKVQVA